MDDAVFDDMIGGGVSPGVKFCVAEGAGAAAGVDGICVGGAAGGF